MCGIAGEIDFKNNLQENFVYENMKNSLKRRGPNQDGIFSDNNVRLIHTRLAVVDIEKGIQPMSIKQGEKEYTLVYNGELYNTEDIRKELLLEGWKFNGHSDTEVLLKSYVQWGRECVNKFNGIFAFAVWEKHTQRLFFARDRMGVKPFFYTVLDGKFIFASEIKALLCHPLIKAQADIGSISELILIAPGRTPHNGVFKNISEITLGECGYFSEKGLKISKYWKLQDTEFNDSFEETLEKVKYLVRDSITRQLVSDVPICTFLSGGLDSSIISAIANKYMNDKGEKLHTFSVNYVDNAKYFKSSKFQPNSDEHYIELMADYLGSEHHNIVIDTEELVDALYLAVDARDLPGMVDVDSSLLLFCRHIKDFATVGLSGECADEIFGGYPWYRDKTIRDIDGFPWSQSTAYRASFLKDEFANQIDCEEYVYSRYRQYADNASKRNGLSPLESRMREMVFLNINWFMQTLLDRKDRMSMYNSLEVRVPFCDYRIAEYLYKVPWEYKDYMGREKGLLRKAVEDILPEEIVWRKKSPYPKTHNPAYRTMVSERLQDILSDSSSRVTEIVKRSELEKLLKTENNIPWYGQLMTTPQTIAYFVQLDYWLKKYNVEIL